MRILVISQTGDGLGVAMRLRVEGHEVAMWIKNPIYKRCGVGIVERVASWREKLRWAQLVIVDMVGMGKVLEPVLRRMGLPFIGASPMLDRLELDRAFGMETFASCGVQIPETWSFGSPEEAKSFFVGIDWGDGFAVKADDNVGCATSRVLSEPEQLDWALDALPPGASLIVQRRVSGVEVSTEGWWNGKKWINFNHTFEEKKFMAGDLGPNTGCMGNVVVSRKSNKLTRATVEKLEPLLVRAGWRGPVDVNCIVDEKGAYALEATARFGYDAIETFLEGCSLGAGELFREVAEGTIDEIPAGTDYCIGVRLSVPPYPSEDEAIVSEWGEPILGINEQNIKHLWLCNVFVDAKDQLFKTAGGDGLTLVATANAPELELARRRVYRTVDNIRVGSKMYRRDIGARCAEDIAKLERWGWL